MNDKQQIEGVTVDRTVEFFLGCTRHWHSVAMARGVMLRELQRELADLQQKLADATEADRRPKHHGYSFHTYDSADAAFIRSYLNRKREERSYEFS